MKHFVKRLAACCLAGAYGLACRWVRPSSRRIVFFSYPDFADNSYHLYRYLAQEVAGYQLVWLTHQAPDKALVARIVALGGANQVLVLKRWSLRGLVCFVGAHLSFHTHGTYFFVKPARRRTLVNLWHGMPIKAIAYLDGQAEVQVACSDYVLATSTYFQPIMADAFRVPLSHSLVTGLPRNDQLREVDGPRRSQLLAELGIPVVNRLIVWLPTYRVSRAGGFRQDATSEHFLDELPADFLRQLDVLAQAAGVSILIKLHPMDCLNDALPVLNLRNISLWGAQAWAQSTVDLYELLACSDALVSDVSSVAIDYLLLKKNVGVFATALQCYSRETLIDLDELRRVTVAIKTPEDVLRVLSAPSPSAQSLEVFHACLGSADQRLACERIKDYFIAGKRP